jgi:3-oxoacyl-[acyl-carrier protein] reductase
VVIDLSAPEATAAGCPGGRAIACDVADAGAVARLAEQIKAEFGGLDLVVNNAGILREKSLKKLELADFDATLRINLGGPFNVLRACGDLIRPGGAVVNMASVAGTLGFFGQAAYAPSKAGVMALTKVAARELARQKVRVNAIAPGVIATDMTAGMKDEVTQAFLQQTPLGRLGTVDDIVGVALFLCSPLAGYITGQVIHVNGGFYMGS